MEIRDEHKRVKFGVFEADLEERALYKRGTQIRVQEKPFAILRLLLEHPGQIVTREELKRSLWADGTFVDFEKGLNTAVKKLRLALGDSTENPVFIETIPRRGYRFIAPVVHSYWDNGDFAGAEPRANSTSSPNTNDSADRSVRGFLSRSRKNRLLTLSFIVLGIAAILVLIFLRPKTPKLDQRSVELTKLTESGTAEVVAISRDGRYVTYTQGGAQGQSVRLRQVATNSDLEIVQPDQGRLLGLTFSADGEFIYLVRADKKDGEFRYLFRVPLLGGAVQRLLTNVDSPVSFSPDGSQFAYERCVPSRNEIELRLASADGTGQRVLAVLANGSFLQFGPGLSWSPDGKTVAVSYSLMKGHPHWVIAVASVETGNVGKLFESADNIGKPVWRPDGSGVIVPRGDSNAHRTQLWEVSFPTGLPKQITKDLTDYGSTLDATPDLATVVAITMSAHTNIWIVSAINPGMGDQMSSGEPALFSPIELPSGKILTSAQNRLWLMNPNGSGRILFSSEVKAAAAPSLCGSSVVFLSTDSGTTTLMRADLDGGHLAKLQEGNLASPVCSPDGRYIYYVNFNQPQNVWRIASTGGVPVRIAQILGGSISGRLSISPNGKLLAYPHTVSTSEPNLGWRMAITPADGGATFRVFDIPSNIGGPRWSQDGRCLLYLLMQNGVSNVWEQPIAGGKPNQITHFASGFIFDLSPSLDGSRLLLTRGDVSSDVVALRGLR